MYMHVCVFRALRDDFIQPKHSQGLPCLLPEAQRKAIYGFYSGRAPTGSGCPG